MRRVGVVVALTLGFLASEAQAQEPPFDPAVDMQLFEYAVGPKSFFTVPNAELASHMQFQVDMMLTFLTDPLIVFGFDESSGERLEERTRVIESILAGQLGAAIGFRDRFQFGLALPLVFSLSGEGIDPATGAMNPGGLQATGLGDVRGEAKMRFLRNGGITVSGLGQISLPTSFGSNDSMFLGDNTPNARVAGVAQWRSGDQRATVGATAGVVLRKPREIYETTVGQQLSYGLAASYQVHEKVSVTGEGFGRAGFGFDTDTSPIEAALGAKLRATEAISVVAGGGAGLLKAVGSPGLRMFLSVAYAPDFRDQDGDGIPNNKDRCPLIKEDRDNFEDTDGCPDHDNDGDKRADAEDKCPMQAEDIDGFQDEDGCPEPDNDNDGLLDGADNCPSQAEDKLPPLTNDGCPASVTDSDDDGVPDDKDKCPTEIEDADAFEDEDGCPDLDNDKDGIDDENDQCSLCAEDKDGFEDEDGCPDNDNDGDGIADAVDQCPLEAEVVNGKDDEDGCPDSGRALVSFDGSKIALSKPIKFSRRGNLRSKKLVDQLALVMKGAKTVAKWRIVVVVRPVRDPEEHKERSQTEADALKQHLVDRGVTADIEAIGAAADKALTAIVALEKKQNEPSDTCSE